MSTFLKIFASNARPHERRRAANKTITGLRSMELSYLFKRYWWTDLGGSRALYCFVARFRARMEGGRNPPIKGNSPDFGRKFALPRHSVETGTAVVSTPDHVPARRKLDMTSLVISSRGTVSGRAPTVRQTTAAAPLTGRTASSNEISTKGGVSQENVAVFVSPTYLALKSTPSSRRIHNSEGRGVSDVVTSRRAFSLMIWSRSNTSVRRACHSSKCRCSSRLMDLAENALRWLAATCLSSYSASSSSSQDILSPPRSLGLPSPTVQRP